MKTSESAHLSSWPLNDTEQLSQLIHLFKQPPAGEKEYLKLLLNDYLSSELNASFQLKMLFLREVIEGQIHTPLLDPKEAMQWLGKMKDSDSIQVLIALLDHHDSAEMAYHFLKDKVNVFNGYYRVLEKSKSHNLWAQRLIESWAQAEWFESTPKLPTQLTCTVFKISGEVRVQDLLPQSMRGDPKNIALYAQSLLSKCMPEAVSTLHRLKQQMRPIVFTTHVLGTGSFRQIALDALIWHLRKPSAHPSDQLSRGILLANQFDPVFFREAQNVGVLTIQGEIESLNTGDCITLNLSDGKILKEGVQCADFSVSPQIIQSVRADGRLRRLMGQHLTAKACADLNLPVPSVFSNVDNTNSRHQSYTLAEKIIGQACGVPGVSAGMYCEPMITTVATQHKLIATARSELKQLSQGLSADLVLQGFSHSEVKKHMLQTQKSSIDSDEQTGGLFLKPSDGIIQPWVNQMVLPDTVNIGGESAIRPSLGMSLTPSFADTVSFSARIGKLPMKMPESILIHFHGTRQPGITPRDLAHAISYIAYPQGFFNQDKKVKENLFSQCILEISGLEELNPTDALLFTEVSTLLGAHACVFNFNPDLIKNHLTSNISFLERMVHQGYKDRHRLMRRIESMKKWMATPTLLKADPHAQYKERIHIDLNTIKEPLIMCAHNHYRVYPLSEIAKTSIHHVFVGSYTTQLKDYYKAAQLLNHVDAPLPTTLWMAPPTKAEVKQLMKEGCYAIYSQKGVRTEMPGFSLCQGKKFNVNLGMNVLSTSHNHFPHRMPQGETTYLTSAECSMMTALLGYLPTVDEYHDLFAKMR